MTDEPFFCDDEHTFSDRCQEQCEMCLDHEKEFRGDFHWDLMNNDDI